MPMVPLYSKFTDLAAEETRTVTIQGHSEMPDGEFGFIEHYCDEDDCDCRRVVLTVVSPANVDKVWATINFGWERVAFYQKWSRGGKEDAIQLKGPFLDPLNAQSESAPAFLRLFREVVCDETYVERLKKHYRLFRSKIGSIDGILAELQLNRGYFPKEAVELAAARSTEITPHLLRILEEAIVNAEELGRQGDYFAHMHALFLLAQFKEHRAYPIVIRLLRMPGKLAEDLLGDTITQDLDRILASICDGDAGPIRALIEDSSVNRWVRSSAVRSIEVMLFEGMLKREEVIDYYRHLLRGGLEDEAEEAWSSVVLCAINIHPGELIEDIRAAFEADLVHSFFVGLEDVEQCLSTDREAHVAAEREKRHGLIMDAIEDMSWWACFNPPPDRDRPVTGHGKPGEVGRMAPGNALSPVAKGKAKTGRNDPCPCGSGKKYKKCCGR